MVVGMTCFIGNRNLPYMANLKKVLDLSMKGTVIF